VNPSQPCTETIPESDPIVGNTDLIRGRGTILLVEDGSFLREVACEILESAGYRVLKAGTAAEAISAFDEYKTMVRLLLTGSFCRDRMAATLPPTCGTSAQS
jgi:hypothetical protein